MSAPAPTNVEAFIPLNGSAGNSAPVTGGRRHRGSKKLKLVTRKQARKLLKKMGRKMRGGEEKDIVAEVAVPEGGRRHRGSKKTRRHSKRSLFGLKY